MRVIIQREPRAVINTVITEAMLRHGFQRAGVLPLA